MNKDSDYHTEMNWEFFSHWCETPLLSTMVRTKNNETKRYTDGSAICIA